VEKKDEFRKKKKKKTLFFFVGEILLGANYDRRRAACVKEQLSADGRDSVWGELRSKRSSNAQRIIALARKGRVGERKPSVRREESSGAESSAENAEKGGRGHPSSKEAEDLSAPLGGYGISEWHGK